MITRRQLGQASVAGLGASVPGAPAVAQKRGGEVVVAQQAQPPSLDAQTTTAQAGRNINLHIYETPFARDETGNPMPDLAEGVDISSDGLNCRFALRTGVKFHNGKVMDAADVKASLNVAFRRAVQAALDLGEIMAISTDGLYRMTHGRQHPGTTHFAGDVGVAQATRANVENDKPYRIPRMWDCRFA